MCVREREENIVDTRHFFHFFPNSNSSNFPRVSFARRKKAMPAVSVTREQALAATGCTKLSEALVARSPFPSVDALVDTMNSIWSGGGGGGGGVGGKFRNSFNPLSDVVVGVPDWLEAFASHPRIGSKSDLEKASAKEQREASAQNKRGAVPRSTSASASAASTLSTLPTLSHAASSAREQAGASSAGAETRAALAEWNELYQQKFGHIYIVCASGRSGEDMLEDLKRR